MSHRSNFLRDRSRDPGTRVCDDMPRKLDSLGQKENHQVNLDMMITDSTHVIPRRQNRPLSQLTLSGWYVTSPLVPSFFGKVTHNWYYVDRQDLLSHLPFLILRVITPNCTPVNGRVNRDPDYVKSHLTQFNSKFEQELQSRVRDVGQTVGNDSIPQVRLTVKQIRMDPTMVQ